MPTLQEILLRASTHPIYIPLLQDAEFYRERHTDDGERSNAITARPVSLRDYPFLPKEHLASFSTLMHTDPDFLRSAYLPPSGGTGCGPTQFYFVTDTSENRDQRVQFASMLSQLRVITDDDIILNLHGGGIMYRSQELIGNLVDLAGGTELSVGSNASDMAVLQAAQQFRPNTLSATSSRMLQFAQHVSTLPEHERVTIRKIIYTSEPLLPAREKYLQSVLGVETIASIYGSAEAGPCFASSPAKIGVQTTSFREFVFDKTIVVVEIVGDDGTVIADSLGMSEGWGQVGEIVITSRCRLRNPLVRYQTGDLGSLQPFHGTDNGELDYHCLHSHGRNSAKSWTVNGEYFDIKELENTIFNKSEYGVLDWQVVIEPVPVEEREDGMAVDGLEFRVVSKRRLDDKTLDRLRQDVVDNTVGSQVRVLMRRTEYEGLERGSLARKVMKVVDRRS
jgi:phenylacetate-coenzyme A ligase PaaK-like adenylate-forming protein